MKKFFNSTKPKDNNTAVSLVKINSSKKKFVSFNRTDTVQQQQEIKHEVNSEVNLEKNNNQDQSEFNLLNNEANLEIIPDTNDYLHNIYVEKQHDEIDEIQEDSYRDDEIDKENQELKIIQEIDEQLRNLENKIIRNNKQQDSIPEIIFLVPYRDRLEQKVFFENYMKIILEDERKYEIYFVHQCDDRPFNRGAMKNIGYLVMKNKYSDCYQNITFVFHDIDTMPHKKNLINYKTYKGYIKHFYGFQNALGGIVSINGADFENINGFMNNWGWGFEDNSLQYRATEKDLKIVRNPFFKLGDNNIIHLFDSIKKLISKKEHKNNTDLNYLKKNKDGIKTLSNINYVIENEYINVYNFKTMYPVPELKDVNLNSIQINSTHKKKMYM